MSLGRTDAQDAPTVHRATSGPARVTGGLFSVLAAAVAVGTVVVAWSGDWLLALRGVCAAGICAIAAARRLRWCDRTPRSAEVTSAVLVIGLVVLLVIDLV